MKPNWVVTVRRENGRYVTEVSATSKYDAKVQERKLREKYDHTYTLSRERRG